MRLLAPFPGLRLRRWGGLARPPGVGTRRLRFTLCFSFANALFRSVTVNLAIVFLLLCQVSHY